MTVVPTPSTVALATSPNSSHYGDPVTLTATVTSGATGTASFYDGSVFLGQGTVTAGVATLSMTTLKVGVHTITATYNGDATYASSMSGPATVTVAKNTAPGSSLTVTVLNESREYGTANPEFSYIVSGTLLNGDTVCHGGDRSSGLYFDGHSDLSGGFDLPHQRKRSGERKLYR